MRTPEPRQQHSRPPPQVLPTQLIPDEKEGKVLRVRFIQKEGVKFFDPVYLFDEGSTISWIPCGRKLTCSFPGIKCAIKSLMRLLRSEIAPSLSIMYAVQHHLFSLAGGDADAATAL